MRGPWCSVPLVLALGALLPVGAGERPGASRRFRPPMVCPTCGVCARARTTCLCRINIGRVTSADALRMRMRVCVFARCAHSRCRLAPLVWTTTHSSAQPLRCTCPTQARSCPTTTIAAPRCYRVPNAHRPRSFEAPRAPLGPHERAAAPVDQTHVWSAASDLSCTEARDVCV